MNINNELKNLKEYRSPTSLKKLLENPIAFCNEKFTSIIPSILSGSDGPYLESLFLISESYLSEVRIGSKGEEFDYVTLKSVVNYRVSLSDLEVEDAEKNKLHYQVALVTLIHNVSNEFQSRLSYVGRDRESWLDLVRTELPVSILSYD